MHPGQCLLKGDESVDESRWQRVNGLSARTSELQSLRSTFIFTNEKLIETQFWIHIDYHYMDLRTLMDGMFMRKPRNYEAVPDEEAYELPISLHEPPTNNRFRRKPLAVAIRFLASPIFHRVLFVVVLIPIIYILSGGIPPLYSDIHKFEKNLPQQQKPSGDRKYLRFEGTLSGLGLNNILQQQLLLSYIAYASNRSFVFSDYTWSHLPLPYTVHEWSLRPTHMPLNTFISGPTAGGDMPSIGLTQDALDRDQTLHDKRAVHVSYFDSVCPSRKRVRLSSTAEARLSDDSLDGDALLNTWVEWLAAVAEEPCVVIDFSKKPVFDHMLFGSERVIAMYPLLAATPILKDFKWSPLVQNSVDRNMDGISKPQASSLIPGLVAVHLRRGDYEGHCRFLVKWSVNYQGMNRYPGIVDHFDPHKYDAYAEQKLGHYLKHCMPDIPQVAARLREVKEQNPRGSLNKVYLLSNGERWWLDKLWVELKKDGWEPVEDGLASSLDLDLTRQEWYVSGAIDMAIAEQAEMFIGNGFSSLTGNIVMFRMAKGVDVGYNRLL